MGCSFLWSPKETNQRKALRNRVSKDFRNGALTYLSPVINKSDGGSPNIACWTNSGQKRRPEFVVELVTPMLDNTVERFVWMGEYVTLFKGGVRWYADFLPFWA